MNRESLFMGTRLIFYPVLLSGFLMMIALLLTHQPYLADDWWWLCFPLKNPAFGWTEPYSFARMPASTFLTVAFLKMNLWEKYPRFFLGVFFSIYSLAYSIFLKTLIEKFDENSKIQLAPFILSCSLFIFLPNNYEIHLWHIMSMNAVGALLIALAFRGKNLFFKITLASTGLLFYDSFIFLLAGFSVFYCLLPTQNYRPFLKMQEIQPMAVLVGISSIVWVLTKLILGKLVGLLHVINFETDPWVVLSQIKVVLRTLWLIHFYKANWVLSLTHWIGIFMLALLVLKNRLLSLQKTILLLMLPTFVALPLSLNRYPAPRAYFGPQMLLGLVFSFLLYLLVSEMKTSTKVKMIAKAETKMWLAPVTLLGVTYLVQWAFIFYVKELNYRALEKEEVSLKALMANCKTPCRLTLPPPGKEVSKDYVLPAFVWSNYYERYQLLNFPTKEIRIEISTR